LRFNAIELRPLARLPEADSLTLAFLSPALDSPVSRVTHTGSTILAFRFAILDDVSFIKLPSSSLMSWNHPHKESGTIVGLSLRLTLAMHICFQRTLLQDMKQSA
jgi:hypothetical protein